MPALALGHTSRLGQGGFGGTPCICSYVIKHAVLLVCTTSSTASHMNSASRPHVKHSSHCFAQRLQASA